MSTDPHAGEELIAHSAWLRRIAAELVGDGAADDLVQQTYVAALTHPPATDRSVRPWLAAVMRNAWRMGTRGRLRRKRRETLRQPLSLELDAELLTERAAQLGWVDEALQALAEPFRSTLRRRYLEEESVQTIAGHDGVAASTVRWRTKVGLDMVRATLDRRHGGDRRLWVAALCPLVNLDSGSRTAAVSLLMKTSTKIAIGIVGVAALAGAATTLASSSSDAEAASSGSTSVTASAPEHRDLRASAIAGVRSDTSSSAPSNPDKLGWERLRARVRAARSKRIADEADEPDEPEPADPAQPEATGAPLEEVGDQLLDTLGRCLSDIEHSGTGEIALSATVLSERDVGTVVDTVDITSRTDSDDDLTECLTEAVYSIDVGPATANRFSRLDFTVDLEEGSISAAAKLDPGDLLSWLADHEDQTPEYQSELEEIFAEAPELAREYPNLAEQTGRESDDWIESD